MAWTPDKVAALLSSKDGSSSERVTQLQEVAAELLGEGEGHDALAAIVEKLADGARDGEFCPPGCLLSTREAKIDTSVSSFLETASRRLGTFGACLVCCARHGTSSPPEQAGSPPSRQCLCRLQ